MLVEQAIFASAQTRQKEGYQLLAVSPGLCDEDARQLTVWCPSHDALLDGRRAVSVNFHYLQSGAYCISRTTPAGEEYSGRRGPQLRTHCLITPAEVFARFANNPFALLRAAMAGGALDASQEIPPVLPALPLVGRAKPVSIELLQPLLDEIGPLRLATALDAALADGPIGIVGGSAARLLSAMLACLPVECRREFPFATGLKYSPQRPFRWNALPEDTDEQRRLVRQFGLTKIDLESLACEDADQLVGWPRIVARCLQSGRTDALAAMLIRPRPGLTTAELPDLAAELAESIPPAAPTAPHADAAPGRRQDGAEVPADVPRPARPSHVLARQTEASIEQLEQLDDAVYDTIAGIEGALKNVQLLWPRVISELEGDLVDQSREQYLIYAMHLWEGYVREARDPAKALAAVDVMTVIFEG